MAIEYTENKPKPRGRPASGKDAITIRLDPQILAHYRAMGKGWHAKLNEDLIDLLKKRKAI